MTARDPRPPQEGVPDIAEIVTIGEGFLAQSFPGDRFHHREHLIVATYLLVRYPDTDWRSALPERIRAYNVAQGGVNDETQGYHHTITMAFLTLVEQMLVRTGRPDLLEACAAVVSSPLTDGDFLLRFYRKSTLFSPEARLGWIDPDLEDIALPLAEAAQEAVS